MKERNYAFDGAISEEVLRNYLSRSIVLSYLGGWRYKDETPEKTAEDCRNLILRTGGKYIARADPPYNSFQMSKTSPTLKIPLEHWQGS